PHDDLLLAVLGKLRVEHEQHLVIVLQPFPPSVWTAPPGLHRGAGVARESSIGSMLLRFGRKGRVAMAGGAMGAVAAWQWKRRRSAPAPAQAQAPARQPDPAQEMRTSRDESR